MKIANARLINGVEGSDIPVRGITPAEAMFLVQRFSPRAGKCAVTHVVELGEAMVYAGRDEDGNLFGGAPRTDEQETQRLKAKYGERDFAKVFPGARPNFPTDFEEALRSAEGLVGKEENNHQPGYLFGNPDDFVKAEKPIDA